ncbi:S9 family peptidase [Luteimonas gilva]|uniref:S9 family peptidase n=1 Tax=Luteimonas gilva TaxID=2572684 RepID=A0A4U5JYI0_9GAMM|nr:S9 family peptidase [Luteimonas gilva]TKR33801.1 S9 family peptidase [Luteimonas gilva]
MNKASIWALLGAFACAQAGAQTIPALDFAKHPEVYEVALSPDGKHVALTVPNADGTETELRIIPLDGGKLQVLRFGKQNHVSDIVWTDNERIVLARARNMPLRPRPYSTGQLFSTNLDGSDQESLFGYFRDNGRSTAKRKDEGFADVVKVLDKEPGKVLVSFSCWDCGEDPDTVIYKVDTATGNRQEVERIDKPAGLIFDNTGRARIKTTLDANDEPVLAYRPTADNAWKAMPKSLAGYTVSAATFGSDDNTLYAEVSDAGEAAKMYKLDLAAGTRAPLPSLPDAELSYYDTEGRDGPPFAVTYVATKPSVQYLDGASEYAKLHAGLMKSFPGELVTFNSFSRDGNVVLFQVWSDRHPPAFYVYNRSSKNAQLVAESMSWIKPAQMAPVRPVSFQSVDGTAINAFYTAQPGSAKPLIVLPHGGPHGVSDVWGFDPDAQFFASRGYGVLQVNYRGSGMRGRNFEKSGYREWGGKMQDDIAAGVKWAIDNKLADPHRICTFGASYGGYAALMQPIRFPELYRCAVGYVGVYDLVVMKKEGDIDDTKSGRRYMDRALGTDEALLIANSPARNAAKIKVPVFLAQGAIDRRVPMAQFNAMKDGFAANGVKVETMVAPGEGHGFYKPETRADLYTRVEKFLQENNGQK